MPTDVNIADVIMYELTNFQGSSRTFGVGSYRLFDFNEMASSIKVPKGLVAYVYEHADSGGGYGISADFLEDCADFSQYNLNDKLSYINVFNAEQPSGLIWVRNSLVNGQFVSGHWERKRADGNLPPNSVVIVSPPIPPHDLIQPTVTSGGTIAVPDSATIKNHVIQAFSAFTPEAQAQWDYAVNHLMGIIGSDYRGIEEIGSAAFERASNNILIPDWLNFWYPQKQPNDHRNIIYFKRTLSGKLLNSHIADITGTYKDGDLNIDIEPSEEYKYLITDGHPREYTDIMSAQWRAHQAHLTDTGKPSCDDAESIAEFSFVEAEIDNDPNAKSRLNSMLNSSLGRQISVYGPWIYDKGHCCHAEIHPAEQIWWGDRSSGGGVYFCNLFCDESERFWWRDQMDDGTKLKPWGAPPITGTFAIAFETEINTPAVQFDITVQDAYNHVTVAENFERHHLVYQNTTLISVVQDPSQHVKVSFEQVDLVGANTVRGFLVIEATVGKCIQNDNPIQVIQIGQIQSINLPPNSDPNQVSEQIERPAFRKEGGRLMLMINQEPKRPRAEINTIIQLWKNNGRNIFQLWDNGDRLGMIVYSPLPQGGYSVSFGSADMGEGSGAIAWLAGDANGDGKTDIFQLWDNNGRLGMIVYSPLPQGGYGVSFGSAGMGEGSGAVAWLADTI